MTRNHERKLRIICLLILFLWICGLAKSSWAQTIYASSCSYAHVHVSAAVVAASSGDTVSVPAGSCTWNAQLNITIPIILEGAGTSNTRITGNITASDAMIFYSPSTPGTSNRFRITGFTLNNDGKSDVIYLDNTSATPEYIRIDHNRIINTIGAGTYRGVTIHGTVFGVVDNNAFEGTDHHVDAFGTSATQWDCVDRNFGDINNLYSEDITFDSEWGSYRRRDWEADTLRGTIHS